MKIKEKPFISFIIPSMNEKKYIRKCIESVLMNNYPQNKIEILVSDGFSKDGTREIVKEFSKKYNFIKLIDNTNKILASAWNRGIENSKGDIIIIANAHAEIEKDHFQKCIYYMNEYKTDCVGPVLITHPQDTTAIGKTISAMMSHPFGVGNSKFRTGVDKPTFVDTVHLGAYKKEVFKKIRYNEDLVRSQDIEMHGRLHRAGFNMLLVPDIKAHYYTRSDPKGFFKFGFINGYWVTAPWAFGTSMTKIRHLVPMTFVWSIIIPILVTFFVSNFYYISFLIITFYLSLTLLVSLHKTIQTKKIFYFFIMPIIFLIYHFTYGIGSSVGFFKSLFSKQFWNFLINKTLISKRNKIL
jgi:glycosyltransferase involved in cell wall biosynthesis